MMVSVVALSVPARKDEGVHILPPLPSCRLLLFTGSAAWLPFAGGGVRLIRGSQAAGPSGSAYTPRSRRIKPPVFRAPFRSEKKRAALSALSSRCVCMRARLFPLFLFRQCLSGITSSPRFGKEGLFSLKIFKELVSSFQEIISRPHGIAPAVPSWGGAVARNSRPQAGAVFLERVCVSRPPRCCPPR